MSRCGASVDYGNATLMDVETKQFVQTCEYDSSNTDLLFHRFTIQVAASIHEDDNYFFGLVGLVAGPGADGTIAGLKLNAIQSYFMTPRREFVYRQGDVEILRAFSAGSETNYLDVNNGPKPIDCKVTHFAGFKSYRIEWTIEVCKILCAPDLSEYLVFPDGSVSAVNASQVINNRWEIEESRDSDWYFTRRLSGQLRVAHWRFIPHAFRYLCLPPLMPNFRRESMRFVQSKDQLTLDWEVVDKQRWAAPPPPAIEWDCKHEERTGVGGAMGDGSVSVKLWGGMGTPKRQLFQVAAQIILDRVADLIDPLAGTSQAENAVIPQEMRIVDTVQDNVAEMHFTYFRVPQPETFINTIFKRVGEPIEGVDHTRWPNPIPYDGNSPAGMFAVYLQNPCSGLHGVPTAPVNYQTEADQPDARTDTNGSNIQVFEGETTGGDVPQDSGKKVSPLQLLGTAPYTWYELESRYVTDTGVVALPYTKNSYATSPSPDEVAFFGFHKGLTKRFIYVKAERVGSYADLPFANERVDPNGIKEVMLHRDVVLMAPQLMPDGVRYKHRLEAELVYGLSRTPALTEKLTSGSIPWDTSTKTETVFIPFANQDEGIA